MKPRSASTRPSINAVSASESEASVSEPLLSWGSSVNVNDDLRRSIHAEIEGVEESIDTLQTHIKNEDRTSGQLAKDFAHARAEMVVLRRTAADELDSATMKDQVRARLKATMRSELMSPTSVVSADPTLFGAADASQEQQQGDEATNAAGLDKPVPTIDSFLKKRAKDLEGVSDSFAKEKETLFQYKAEKQELESEMQTILARIESGKVEEGLESAKKETSLREEEHEMEERRKRSTKEATQKVRAQCGHHAQKIADQTKILSSKKTKNADQEAEMALRLKHMEEEIRSDESMKEIESKFSSVSEQIVQLNRQLEDFDSIRDEEKSTAAEREATKQETEQELVKSKNEFQVKIDDARSTFASSSVRLEESKALRAAVETERVDNDKVHAEQVLPGQTERNALMEEKEDLAKSVNNLHEESVSNEKESSKGLVTQSETLNKLDLDSKDVSGELAEKRATIESIKKTREQMDEATQKELEEHREFRAKFEEATAAEKARIEELHSERDVERKERCEEARESSRRMRAQLDVKREAYRAGADLLATTIELENQ